MRTEMEADKKQWARGRGGVIETGTVRSGMERTVGAGDHATSRPLLPQVVSTVPSPLCPLLRQCRGLSRQQARSRRRTFELKPSEDPDQFSLPLATRDSIFLRPPLLDSLSVVRHRFV
jgi:hypothetical protein